MYSHILATLDGSALSEAVLPQVEKLAAGTPLRVTLLAVAEDPSPISSTPSVVPERLIHATGSLQEAALQEIDVHREGETHEQAIERYLAVTNQHATPFVWTKTADAILASVARFCQRISDSGH